MVTKKYHVYTCSYHRANLMWLTLSYSNQMGPGPPEFQRTFPLRKPLAGDDWNGSPLRKPLAGDDWNGSPLRKPSAGDDRQGFFYLCCHVISPSVCSLFNLAFTLHLPFHSHTICTFFISSSTLFSFLSTFFLCPSSTLPF